MAVVVAVVVEVGGVVEVGVGVVVGVEITILTHGGWDAKDCEKGQRRRIGEAAG